MRYAGYVSRVGKEKNAYKVVVEERKKGVFWKM
jgi:hypothetical protein